ncbi:MAG TPA: PH domain-containing protein [Candidatus Dormibacteraeota bacterium]|nr:PH domain-containing protein [Candidatus Dormibacteraeota bacterium]
MTKNLLAGEQPIRVARQHWATFLPVAGAALLMIAVGAVVVVLLGHLSVGHIDTIRLFLALVVAVVALGLVLARYARWRFTTYTLTNRRIIVSRGILSRYMESINLDRVQNISTSMGILGRVVKSGNVEIESAGRDGNEVLARIQDPMGFSNAIESAAEALRFGGWPSTPQGGPPQAGDQQEPQQHGIGEGYVPPGGQSGYGPPPGYGTPPRRSGGV